MCVKGSAVVSYNQVDYTLNMGESMLLPAAIDHICIKVVDQADLIEVFL
jgi:hypothetical protein